MPVKLIMLPFNIYKKVFVKNTFLLLSSTVFCQTAPNRHQTVKPVVVMMVFTLPPCMLLCFLECRRCFWLTHN